MATQAGPGADAIHLLRNDHRGVDQLFTLLEAEDDPERKASLIEQAAELLRVHTSVEEEVLYPTIQSEVSGGRKLAKDAMQEHQEVNELLDELEQTDPASPEADDLVRQLIEGFRQHVEEEEGQDGLFAALREALGQDGIYELGGKIGDMKARLTGDELDSDEGPPPTNTPGGVMFQGPG